MARLFDLLLRRSKVLHPFTASVFISKYSFQLTVFNNSLKSNVKVFCDKTLSSLVDKHDGFGRIYCLPCQGED